MFASWYGLRARGRCVPAVGGTWRLCTKIGEGCTESLGGSLLADQYKMDEEEVQTRWDKASLYNSTGED